MNKGTTVITNGRVCVMCKERMVVGVRVLWMGGTEDVIERYKGEQGGAKGRRREGGMDGRVGKRHSVSDR